MTGQSRLNLSNGFQNKLDPWKELLSCGSNGMTVDGLSAELRWWCSGFLLMLSFTQTEPSRLLTSLYGPPPPLPPHFETEDLIRCLGFYKINSSSHHNGGEEWRGTL